MKTCPKWRTSNPAQFVNVFRLLSVPGEMISMSNSKYLTHEFILSEYSIRSRLTIRDFNSQDIGIYKCTCKNVMNTGDRVEGMVFLAMEKGKNAPLHRPKKEG